MFAVYGMTKSYAKLSALKAGSDDIDAFIEMAMESKRNVRVSNEFSTIEIAREFLELAKKDGGIRLTIRVHIKDYKAKPKGKSKKDYVLRWVDMDEYSAMPGAMRR
jgi:hypothetical protein